MKVAVIPARGGSKRIPRKNIRLFLGKPMIAWSIEAAIKSGCFDQIIVSTDDPEIIEVSERFGASAPFIRPKSLSDDFTGTTPVIKHAINELNKNLAGSGKSVSHVCCVYATAPMMSPEDIRRGLADLNEKNCEFTFSVTSYAFPIQRAIRLNSLGRVEMFEPKQFAVRSQDLEPAFHDAAQFYWGKAEAWLEEKVIFSPHSVPVIIPRYRVQDIDTEEDWVRTEALARAVLEIPHP